VLLQDRVPAYIRWAQFERHQAQLAANQTAHLGPVRSGRSLLSGLVICGRCGWRMAAVYTSSGGRLRYDCSRMAVDYGEPRCQSLVGQVLDEWVSG
jgi:Recombinase zinc beta ribbon domain